MPCQSKVCNGTLTLVGQPSTASTVSLLISQGRSSLVFNGPSFFLRCITSHLAQSLHFGSFRPLPLGIESIPMSTLDSFVIRWSRHAFTRYYYGTHTIYYFRNQHGHLLVLCLTNIGFPLFRPSLFSSSCSYTGFVKQTLNPVAAFKKSD